jgi:hypothetical protein
MSNINREELEKAYVKLKSHFYHDSSDLFQRRQIAMFETSEDVSPYELILDIIGNEGNSDKSSQDQLKKKFDKLSASINKFNTDDSSLDCYFKLIKLQYLPKKIKSETNFPEEQNFLTNIRTSESYEIERLNVFIDIPVELHLVVVIWVLRYGYILDRKLSQYCYGNRLLLRKSEKNVIDGSGLFKPYYKQYQKWRDNGIIEAKRKLDNDEDIAFINLDIKEYFYSVNIDFDDIEKDISSEIPNCQIRSDSIHSIFKRIHTEFTKMLSDIDFPKDRFKKNDLVGCVLPIGLISSSIIANWYLKDFDNKVIEEVRPAYYGRYVDDILILITNPVIQEPKDDGTKEDQSEKKHDLSHFLRRYLNPIAEYNDKKFELRQRKGCFFQSDKTLVYHFSSSESSAAIDKLKYDLEKRASEFRDIPEESVGDGNFNDQAFHLIFDNSQGKFSTLKDYKENRYGLSTFLSNRIFTALRRVQQSENTESQKILKLFKGINALDNFRLWEKIFMFFLANDDRIGFVTFYKNTHSDIENIKPLRISKSKIKGNKVATSLISYLNLACEMTLALHPRFIKEHNIERELEYFINEKKSIYSDKSIDYDELTGPLTRFRHSNLIRHHFVVHPLINYSDISRDKPINLISRRNNSEFEYVKFKENNDFSVQNNPRNVKFWECCIDSVRKHLYEIKVTDSEKKVCIHEFFFSVSENYSEHSQSMNSDYFNYLETAFNNYYSLNKKLRSSNFSISGKKNMDEIVSIFRPKNAVSDFDKKLLVQEYQVNHRNRLEDAVNIAFANIELDESNLKKSMRGEPNITVERFNQLSKILNQTSAEKAKILILPECSVPHDLLPSIAQWSERSQIMVIAGIEHWKINEIIYNIIVTILPTEIDGIRDAVIIYRLKNFYSHDEKLNIEGEGFIVPQPKFLRYDLINWRGMYFSPYYCFELANSVHRSLFRSKIDLLIASEWNKDTNYFSNIVESLARDLHVYVAQVNSSEYGDSRLTQPASADMMDVLRLKGGKNSTILVGSINIHSLREFQRKSYALTKNKSIFKPLPPDFDRKSVLNRIENRLFFKQN